MRLAELEPRWVTPNVFIFMCPHCVAQGWSKRQHWISCKNIEISSGDQWELFQRELGDRVVVSSKPTCAWEFIGNDFASLTVKPSIDASPSGDWHGHITDGNIVGGI